MNKSAVHERRKKVAALLCKNLTEMEIARTLGGNVSQATVSRDIQALREDSQRFVNNLAKSDLPLYYMECVANISDVRQKILELYADASLKPRDKLQALKLIVEAEQARFSTLKDGPTVMAVRSLEEKVDKAIGNNST